MFIVTKVHGGSRDSQSMSQLQAGSPPPSQSSSGPCIAMGDLEIGRWLSGEKAVQSAWFQSSSIKVARQRAAVLEAQEGGPFPWSTLNPACCFPGKTRKGYFTATLI